MHPICTRRKGQGLSVLPFGFIDLEVLIPICYLQFLEMHDVGKTSSVLDRNKSV